VQGYLVGGTNPVAVVINARMEKCGMRWKRANATAVVVLQVQHLNAQ
jgi:hypothetical protein